MREAASGILVLIMLVPVPFLSPHLVAQQQGIHVPYLEELSSIPGWGRSPGGGNGNLLQYSCLKNPMDRGAWWAIVKRSDITEHTQRNTHT